MTIVFSSSVHNKLEGMLNKVESTTVNEPAYTHLVKAEALRIKSYFWDSIEEYLNALSYDDTKLEAFIGLGLSYKQLGLTKSAVSAFQRGKKINPFEKNLYFETGCCYCMDRDFPKGIREFKKAIKLCPNYTEARYNLAMAYEMSGSYAQAITEYNRIIVDSPDFVQAYNSLASLYIRLDQYRESIRVFRELLRINPDYARAYLGIAISFDKIKAESQAVRYYKKYLKIRPNSDNISYVMKRISELKKKTFLQAETPRLKLIS